MKTNALILGVMGLVISLSLSEALAGVRVIERGPFHKVEEFTQPVTNQLGEVTFQESQITMLENGLHYLDNGQWLESQDLVELGADGTAVAYKGQHKVIFNPNLNTPGAIDLLSASGKRLRSHPVGLFYFDAATGQSVLVGQAQDSVGELVTPNQVVYRDAFDGGVTADIRYTYAKNGFEQDVILRQLPISPSYFGLNPDTTRLEIWTEFIDAPTPVKKLVVLKQENDPQRRGSMVEPDLVDELLDFGDFWFPVAGAFKVNNQQASTGNSPAQIRLPSPSDQPVLMGKRWMQTENRNILIEAVDWRDLETEFGPLIQASADKTYQQGSPTLMQGRRLPAAPQEQTDKKSFQLAQQPYVPNGFVLDYITLIGNAYSYSFGPGTTYYIPSGFGVGPGITQFNPSVTIKYGEGAYLYTYGQIECQNTLAEPVVFTSKDDDTIGEWIQGSTGNPNITAAQELWVYYFYYDTFIKNMRFRWAVRAIQYDTNPGVYNSHTVSDTNFEHCETGIYANNTSVELIRVQKCDVDYPTYGEGQYSFYGEMTDNVNVSKKTYSIGEPDVAINPTDPDNIVIFAVPEPTEGKLYQMTSNDGGITWNVTDTTSFITAANVDPSLAFDKFGNLFLAYLSKNKDIVVVQSSDKGASWTERYFKSGNLDKPVLATGPDTNSGYETVWVSFMRRYPPPKWEVLCIGAKSTWLGDPAIFNYERVLQFLPDSGFGQIAVGPGGKVAVSCQTDISTVEKDPNDPENPEKFGTSDIYVSINPNGLTGEFGTPVKVVSENGLVGYDQIPAHPIKKIYTCSGLAWDRYSGSPYFDRLYLAYADEIPNESDNTEVFLRYSDDNGSTWHEGNGGNQINDDTINGVNTFRSQFLPRIALDQKSGNIAVCWYDCRRDSQNQWAEFYASVSQDGGQSFWLNIPMSSGQSHHSLDDPGGYFDYGDYPGLDFYKDVFFAVWADNSNSTGDNSPINGKTYFDIYSRKYTLP